MDMRDKQFDSWISDNLNSEIMLSKQNRQLAWEQIRLTVAQPTAAFTVEDDFLQITAPIIVHEPLHSRIWNWVIYLVTQENTYHKAHAHSAHYYKGKPNYTGGLNLHRLELVRYRWICPV